MGFTTGARSFASSLPANNTKQPSLRGSKLPPKSFLRDTGEWNLFSSGAKSEQGFGGRGAASSTDLIQMNEADMEMLADFEEEQQRRGHF